MADTILVGHKDISLKICNKCKKIFYRNKWLISVKFEDRIIEIINNSLKLNPIYSPIEIDIILDIPEHKQNPGISVDATAKIIVQTEFNDELITEEYVLPFILNYTYCPPCSKSGTKYFEGVLQLRKLPIHVLNEIHSMVKEYSKKGLHINKQVKCPNGIDYYLTKKSFAKIIVQKLYKKYGGIIKISPRVFSQDKQTGKVLYRLNAYYEFPSEKKDSFVILDDKIYKVITITNFLTAIDLMSNKKVSIDIRKKSLKNVIFTTNTIVSSIKPLKVLDKDSDEEVKPVNKPENLSLNQDVTVTKINDKIWILI